MPVDVETIERLQYSMEQVRIRVETVSPHSPPPLGEEGKKEKSSVRVKLVSGGGVTERIYFGHRASSYSRRCNYEQRGVGAVG